MCRRFYILLLAILLASATHLMATAYVWVGGGPDGNWTTTSNWDPVGLPGAGDEVSIGGNGGPTLVGDTEVGSVNMSDFGSVYRPFNSTYSLTINNELNYAGGGFAVDLVLGIDCLSNLSGSGSVGFSGITVINYGEIYCNTDLNLYYSILKNHGTFYCSGPYAIHLISNPGNVENYGVFKLPSTMAGVFVLDAFLENKPGGSVVLESGTLQCNAGTLQNEGNISVEAGAILVTNGPSLKSGTTISGQGTWKIVGNPCNFEVHVVDDVATTDFDAQSIVGANGELTINHDFIWHSGLFLVPTTLANSGHLIANGAGGKSIFNNFTANLTFINEGLIEIESAISIWGTLQNNGQVDINTATGIYGIGTIQNAGTISKAIGSGNLVIEPNLINANDGMVEIQDASCTMEGYLENIGQVQISANATLVLNSIYGNQVAGNGNFTGSGTLVAFGYLDILSNLALEITEFKVTGYGLRGTGTLGISNQMSWESGIVLCQLDINGGTLYILHGNFVAKQLAVGLTNNGTISSNDDFIVGPEHFSLPAVTFQNNGLFELIGGSYVSLYYLFENQFVNSGVFRKLSPDFFEFDLDFVNQPNGTLEISSGEIRFKNLVNHGSINILPGAVVNVREGTYHIGSSLTGGGLIKITENGFNIQQSLNLNQTQLYLDGMLTGVGSLSIGSIADWEDGQLGVPTIVEASATLNFNPIGSRQIDGNFTNYGTINFNGYNDCSANIINNGNFFISNSGGLNQTGTANFTNNSLFELGNGAGFSMGVPLSNPIGILNIQEGSLNCSNGLDNGGTINLLPDGFLSLCGTSNLSGNSVLSLQGEVAICGDLTLGLDLNFGGDQFTLEYGGSISGVGLLTIESHLNWTNGDVNIPINVTSNAIADIGEGGGGGGGNVQQNDGEDRMSGIGVLRNSFTNAGICVFHAGFDMEGGQFINNGTVTSNGVTLTTTGSGGFTNNSNLGLDGGINFEGVQFINSGTIGGTGNFDAAPTPINTGTIAPGFSPGQINFLGDFFPGNILLMEIQDNSGEGYGHDYIYVNGDVNLSGQLIVNELANAPDGEYVLLETAGAINGNFASTVLPQYYALSITSNKVKVSKNSILPVELIDFNASYDDDNKWVHLDWHTINESNNLGFYIERRSESSSDWLEIGFVESNRSSQGGLQAYFYIDKLWANFDTETYYRLKQMDVNGDISYGPVRGVSQPLQSQSLNAYPNPFTASIHVQLSVPSAEAQVKIFDAFGRLVWEARRDLNNSGFDLSIPSLCPGIYWLDVNTSNNYFSKKIIKDQD